MEPSPPIQAQPRTRIDRRRVVYETACALAESASLAEAAPRMLEAICGALGWEFGLLWRLDHAAHLLRHIASWHQPSLQCDEFTAVSRETAFARVCSTPTAGVNLNLRPSFQSSHRHTVSNPITQSAPS